MQLSSQLFRMRNNIKTFKGRGIGILVEVKDSCGINLKFSEEAKVH